MQYHAIPCNTMQYNGTLITADGAYHCPVGSIMAIFIILRPQSLGEIGIRYLVVAIFCHTLPTIRYGKLYAPGPAMVARCTRSESVAQFFFLWNIFLPQNTFLPQPSKHFFLNNWFLPKMIHHLLLKAGFQELEHTLLSHIFGKGTFAQSRMKNLGPLHRTWTLASIDIKTSLTSFCFNNTFSGGGWTTTQI